MWLLQSYGFCPRCLFCSITFDTPPKLIYHDRKVYVSLFKNGDKENDQFHLVLYKGREELQNLDIVSGSFSGISMDFGEPIAAELLLVKESDVATVNNTSLKAIRHLNLKRNRFKVFRAFQTDGTAYNPNLPILENFVGTHLIGRIYHREEKTYMILSVLRMDADYTTTLQHPSVRDHKLKCLINITQMNPQSKVLFIEVLYQNTRDTYITLMIRIPAKDKITKGQYCGITPNEVISGKIGVYKLNNDSNFNIDETKPKRILIEKIKDNPAYLAIFDIVKENNSSA